jgi:DNA polymerase-3 subunit beta
LKLTVSRETFLAKLGIAVRGASTRSAIQTLAGVHVRVADGRAELEATDMELGVRVGLEVGDSTSGRAVIPGRLLLDVVRSLPTDELSLEYRSAQQDVEVVSGPARFHLRTLPPEDFPKLPQAPAEGAMSVPAGAFVDTIGRVARAASRDETRPHLTGVLVTARGQELRMVATDSYRLSVKETRLEQPLDGELEANVPARTLQELGRIASAGGAGSIGVTALENQVVFTVDDVMLSSRLVEGRFPNYQQLLPESYEHELRVNRGELLEVVRRVGLLAQKNAPLRLRFSEGALDVSAQTPDVGEASESLPVPFNGEPLEIGFNPEFFRDGLESAESDELVLKLISPLRPGLIESGRGEGDGGGESGGFLYLVMPIRLNV